MGGEILEHIVSCLSCQQVCRKPSKLLPASDLCPNRRSWSGVAPKRERACTASITAMRAGFARHAGPVLVQRQQTASGAGMWFSVSVLEIPPPLRESSTARRTSSYQRPPRPLRRTGRVDVGVQATVEALDAHCSSARGHGADG